jgi:hypothetical protein
MHMLQSNFFNVIKIYRALKAKLYLPIPDFSHFIQPQLAGFVPETFLENDGIRPVQYDNVSSFFDGIWLMGVPKSKVFFKYSFRSFKTSFISSIFSDSI